MARHAGVFEVGRGYVDGFRRNVGANDGDGDFAFGAVVVIDFVEKVAVEVWPRFECEVFAEYAGGDVGCYQSRLAQEGATIGRCIFFSCIRRMIVVYPSSPNIGLRFFLVAV